MNHKKNWTILIYADGNNEMEEVMYNAFLQLNTIKQCENINVIIEMGLLRSNPSASFDKWSGVRRYYIGDNIALPSPKLIEDLGKINMADPNNLYKFIAWGIKTCPAEHYMVIISGHGTNFVGGLTDLSHSSNYIMGIPEMFKAISLGSIHGGFPIDILLLDMCFMNSIETLYEVSQYDNNIKALVNYTNFAPYEGLNYSELINIIDMNYEVQSTNLLLENLIRNLPYDLIAYKLDKTSLEAIKNSFDALGLDYLNKALKSNPLNLLETLYANSDNLKDYSELEERFIKYVENIDKVLKTIVIFTKYNFLGLSSSINITSTEIGRLIGFYKKLAFSKKNHWTKLLSKVNPTEINTKKVMVRTLDSSISSVHYILEINAY